MIYYGLYHNWNKSSDLRGILLPLGCTIGFGRNDSHYPLSRYCGRTNDSKNFLNYPFSDLHTSLLILLLSIPNHFLLVPSPLSHCIFRVFCLNWFENNNHFPLSCFLNKVISNFPYLSAFHLPNKHIFH